MESPGAASVAGMTTATVEIPFATASPAEIREAILPEDVPDFDRQYRHALNVAAQTYRLDELEKTLVSWRLNARQVAAEGPEAWQANSSGSGWAARCTRFAPTTRLWSRSPLCPSPPCLATPRHCTELRPGSDPTSGVGRWGTGTAAQAG